MSIDEIKAILQGMLSPRRFNHSVKVMEAAVQLAEKYSEDIEKAALAGLVHDCAKDLAPEVTFDLCNKYGIIVDKIMWKQPKLLHGLVGSYLARDILEVDCPDVLSAVADHTMGRPGMDKLSRIVFIADYIDATRDYPEVERIAEAAQESLEKAIVAGIDCTIANILAKGELIHPRTVETRNWALGLLESGNPDIEQSRRGRSGEQSQTTEAEGNNRSGEH